VLGFPALSDAQRAAIDGCSFAYLVQLLLLLVVAAVTAAAAAAAAAGCWWRRLHAVVAVVTHFAVFLQKAWGSRNTHDMSMD